MGMITDEALCCGFPRLQDVAPDHLERELGASGWFSHTVRRRGKVHVDRQLICCQCADFVICPLRAAETLGGGRVERACPLCGWQGPDVLGPRGQQRGGQALVILFYSVIFVHRI
eukprot:3143849-Rhodomonas_salina.2